MRLIDNSIDKYNIVLGELMIARARNFGSERQLEEAKGLKVSSCDNLQRLGLTKYILH